MIGIYSRGIARIDNLTEFLGEPWTSLRGWSTPTCDRVAGWGLRPTSAKARLHAERHGLPFVMLEDGFLRSVGLGSMEAPLSMVMDDSGIYYDGSRPSRLESLVNRPHTEHERARARALISAWREARVSKYNHARELQRSPGQPLPFNTPYVLVADQTFGDASIGYGLANAASFQRMLDAALVENPDCTIVMKVHPEVMTGRKKGHYDLALLSRNPRIHVLGDDVHPASLLEHAQAIYTVTSQMGFEGLLWGKRVRTFGMPFYAGWGLTQDELPPPERRRSVSLEDLTYAALVDYPRYVDPETGKRCEPERLIEWMGLQRRMRERFPAKLYALKFSRWKKPIVRDFLQGSSITFVRDVKHVPEQSTLIVWGKKPLPGTLSDTVRLIRLEDGFIRSVGLGAELVRPLSWVCDTKGIYYDASAPSDLESLLQSSHFEGELLVRAKALREAICARGITKYNVGSETWSRPADAKRVILVPGQVETDASIRFGAAEIRHNVELLKAVRAANPDACVLYKPHPDVRAALRRQGVGESEAANWCDEILDDVPFDKLLDQVDEVHVLTSLGGFEALMRGKRVVCYGHPFYAGWGLTQDIFPCPRRTRRLAVDELVAATLILYPTYISRRTGKFTTPERALAELLEWKMKGPKQRPLWRRWLALALRKD